MTPNQTTIHQHLVRNVCAVSSCHIFPRLLIRSYVVTMSTDLQDSALQPAPNPRPLALTDFPVEIITRILEIVVELPTPEAYGNVTYTPPLRLGRICREWREVAWSLPTLWSDIRVVVKPSADEDQGENRVEILQGWLERGKQTLMRVEVIETTFGTREMTALVLGLLQPTSARWQSLNLHAAYPEDLDISTLQLPFLRRLAIQCTTDSDESEDTILDFDSSTFRSVETLFITRMPIRISSIYSQTDIGHHIADLSLAYITVVEAVNLLTLARRTIVSCRLQQIVAPDNWTRWESPQYITGWRSENPAILPHLSRLHIHWLGAPLRSVLACIQTPALKEFHLSFGGWSTPLHHQFWDESILGLFAGPNTSESLEHLALDAEDLPLDVFTQMVVVCKGLKRMSIYVGSKSSTALLATLLGVEESSPYLPHMEYLEYLNSKDDMHDDPLLKAIKTRWRSPETALRGVRFKHSDRPIVSRALEKEIDEGLDVRFGFGYDDD